MPLDIFLKLNPCNFKHSKRPLKMPYQKFPPMRKPNNKNMRIIQTPSILINFLQSHAMPRIEINIMKDHHEFFDDIINFSRWFNLSSNEYFNRNSIIKYLIKLIHLYLFIIFYLFFICYLFIFDCLWLLSFLFWQLLTLFSLFHF